MVSRARSTTITAMSYAILWSENGDPVRAGKLVAHADRLVLEGAQGGGLGLRRELAYRNIRSVRIARGLGDRLDGRRVAILETGEITFKVASLAGIGELDEIVSLVDVGLSRPHTAR
jgi:hypothetical protein